MPIAAKDANNTPFNLDSVPTAGGESLKHAVDDGQDVTLGAKADAPATTADVTPWSVISLLKGLLGGMLTVVATIAAGAVKVAVQNFPSNQTVSGTVAAIQSGGWAVAATQSGAWGVSQVAGPWSGNLTQVAGAGIATGHGTAAGAVRVELPTDSTGVITANLGTLNGAATAANQTSELSYLSNISSQTVGLALASGQPGLVNGASKTVRIPVRQGGSTVLRAGITAPDKVAQIVSGISTALQSGGSLPTSALYVVVIPYNQWGSVGNVNAVVIGPTTPSGGNLTIRVNGILSNLPANATGVSVFCSTSSTAPLFLANVPKTGANSLTNGALITGQDTLAAGSVAGSVDIQVVGTGPADNVAPFVVNTALVPPGSGQDCTGTKILRCYFNMTLPSFRVAPQLTLVPCFLRQDDGLYYPDDAQAFTILTGEGACLLQSKDIIVNGAKGFNLAVATVAGTNFSLTIATETVY